ncbi:MAG: hypothetical protein Gaeavirus38_4, partial [Gaeavirus sp.]
IGETDIKRIKTNTSPDKIIHTKSNDKDKDTNVNKIDDADNTKKTDITTIVATRKRRNFARC